MKRTRDFIWYSNFRTIEGIGILRLMLLANGFAEFKLTRREGNWEIEEKEKTLVNPDFIIHWYRKRQKKRKSFVIFTMVLGIWCLPTWPNNLENRIAITYMVRSSKYS